MPPFLRITLIASLVLAAPPRAHAAPPKEAPVTEEDLGPVFNSAKAMESGLHCTSVAPGASATPENIAAATSYGNIAGMYVFIADSYPPVKVGRTGKINNLLDDAVLAYEHAYECNPGMATMLYLQRAIDLLSARIALLTPTDELAQAFTTRLARLQDNLARPSAPPPCRICDACPTCATTTDGYRGRYAGRVALGIALGGGRTTLRDPPNKLVHFTLRIALGPRFVLGPRKRHILCTGLHLAIHQILKIDGDPPADHSAIYQAGPYLEYGFAPSPPISLHAHVDMSIGAGSITSKISMEDSFRGFRAYSLGGGAALCTLSTALCARVHGQNSVNPDAVVRRSYDITLSLDVFRLADFVLARRNKPIP